MYVIMNGCPSVCVMASLPVSAGISSSAYKAAVENAHVDESVITVCDRAAQGSPVQNFHFDLSVPQVQHEFQRSDL